MRLTRRDALAAVATATGAVAGCVAPDAAEPALDGSATTTLVAAAEVVYPDAVENVDGFVRMYAEARTRDDLERRRGVEAATADLDDAARTWYGDPLPALSLERRESVLREVGADTADPERGTDGSLAGRVRFHIVNELLYALYTSPAGGRLAGVENPVGHPGGTTTYRQGPR